MPRNPKAVDPDHDEKGDVEKRHIDKLLDEALAETFPASDPPAMIGSDGVKVGAGPKAKPEKKQHT
jgi:hypothetical protein